MDDPSSLFRNVLAVLLAFALVVGISFRLRSHTRERLDRRQEGWPILISLRLSGLLFWVVLLVWIFNPTALSWAAIDLPAWMRWTGVGLFLGAAMWMSWMFRWLGANLTDTVVTRQSAYMVTGGPYRWVRHPMYAAVLPLGIAVSLITANLLFVTMSGCGFLIIRARTRREEQNLLARFGDQYRNYMQHTGRFFPAFWQHS